METNGAARHGTPDAEVAVIGAGFGGICAGVKLKEAGLPFEILEQANEVGGCWRDNTYPGVAVDINSFTYSFSFAPNPRWSRAFAPGEELKRYAETLVDQHGLRDHIRFDTRVECAEFDERAQVWQLRLGDGSTRTARFVIGAPGGLTQPKYPDIPGLEDFAGPAMHTARWDHSQDLTGRRVAVIGTGASAVQVVPALAPTVSSLSVFQRTPIWVMPKPDVPIPGPVQTMFRVLPPAQQSVRLLSGLATEAVLLLGVMHNRELPLLTKAVEALGRAHLRSQVPDRELREKLTPRYGFGCKRPVVSSDYFSTFMRENVDLVTDGIERITETGIQTSDGRLHEVDVLILATGFKVFQRDNVPSFDVVGVGGRNLGAWWDEERYQAYESVSVPSFPNLFVLLGPYGLGGGSYLAMLETNTRHAVRVIREARRRKATSVAVRQEAHDAYFEDIQRRMRSTVFFNNNCGAANSYYFDRHGDAPLLRPHTGVEMWWRSRTFDLDDYEYQTIGAVAGARGLLEATA